MNLRGLIMASLSVKFVYSATEPPNICINKETKEVECCNDFMNISGICKACIGTYGKNCLNNCLYGFHGHGCRNKCDCTPQQICDRRQGCITATSVNKSSNSVSDITKDSTVFETVTLTVVCVLILLVCCGLLYYCRVLKNRENSVKQEVQHGQTSTPEQPDDQESIFIYREGESGSVSSEENMQSMNQGTLGYALATSRIVEPNTYEHSGMEFEDYNHLNFQPQKS